MKYILPVAAVILLSLILSAGCIGTQTTDLVIGNETVGKIYLTPVNEKLLTNSSLTDKFDMRVDLMGYEFSKEGINKSEADAITKSLSQGIDDRDIFSDLGFDMIYSSTFEADSLDEIIDQIVNMPISATDSTKVSEALDMDELWKNSEELANQMMKMINLSL